MMKTKNPTKINFLTKKTINKILEENKEQSRNLHGSTSESNELY